MTVLESLEESLQELPDEERDELSSAFVEVLDLFRATAEPLSDTDRRVLFKQLSQVLEDVTSLVIIGAPGVGKSHIAARALAETLGSEDEQPSLAELEKLNTANRFEQWKQVIRESFSTAELEKKLGVSRQQLRQWREARKLLWLEPPFERSFFYPVWEFDEQGRPHELVPAITQAAEEARLDTLSLHRLMVSETATPRGPLMLALKAGDDEYVLDAVRAAGAQGG